MKRGNNNTKITDADRPSHVDEEDDDAGDEEQGFSTAITPDDDVNTTADQSGPRIIGLEQVSGDGDAAAPILLSQLASDLGIDTTEKSSSPPEELTANDDAAPIPPGHQFDDVAITAKAKAKNSSPLLEELKEEEEGDNTSYSMESREDGAGNQRHPSPLLPHDDEDLIQQQESTVSGNEEDTQVPSVDREQEREPPSSLPQAYVVEESEGDAVLDAEVVQVVFCPAELLEPDSPWRKHKIFIIFCISVLALAISLGVGLGVAFSRQSCFVTRSELKAAVGNYALLDCNEGANVCPSLSKYGWPINSWCVGNVRDMSYLFIGASSFNDDISSWDVSRVQDMSFMFCDASSFNGDLSSWDASQVQNMSYMFYRASSFNGDLSSWDVSQVEDMRWMFREASSFNDGISSWDTSQVTDMRYMFYDASSFNGDLSLWNVSRVQDMSYMFYRASSFNGDISSWNVSQVQYMSYMFYVASAFNQSLCEWADKNFPYNNSSLIFVGSGCTYKSDPQVEQGGPFCASTCI